MPAVADHIEGSITVTFGPATTNINGSAGSGSTSITVNMHSPEPGYQQLARQLRERITSGQIAPREALPSITYLTGETGLAVGTVRRAIALLVEEGYAYTVPGRGTYAAKSSEAPPPAD